MRIDPDEFERQVEATVGSESGRYRTLFDRAPGAYLVTDASGGIRLANAAAALLLGAPSSLLEGKPLAHYISEEHRGLLRARLEALARGEAADGWEARLTHGAGDPVYVALVVACGTVGGEEPELLWILHDITQRRNAEEERRILESRVHQAQSLESLGVLAGGVAHDFNNLLTGILVNASLALLDLDAQEPMRAMLQQIEALALRASDLTRQLQAFSGRGRLLIQKINLSRFLEEMTPLLQSAVSMRAVLEFACTPDLPTIDGDPGQLRQAVLNLVTNATEAIGHRKGIIRLTTGVTHADRASLGGMRINGDLPEGDYIRLEVSDTGGGMDEVTRARLFDPFFSTKPAGRGLGLCAVLGIARRHHAVLGVSSEPGRGTTIRILFPCAGTAADQDPAAPPSRRRADVADTVLVVEDEEVIRDLTRVVLERAGFKVLVAADGRSALDLFERRRGEIAAVVVDLTMPRMSGTDLLHEIWQGSPGLPAVVISGYDEKEADSHFRGRGEYGFVQKPFRPAELVAALQRRLEG